MELFRSKPYRNNAWRLLFGLLCLALVALGSTIQVAHTHPGGDIPHADCALCLAAHVVAQVVSNPVSTPAALVIALVEEALSEVPPAKQSIYALFTRPPPAVSRLAQ